MSRRQPVVEVMNPMMVEVMRNKTPAERLAIAFRMWTVLGLLFQAACDISIRNGRTPKSTKRFPFE